MRSFKKTLFQNVSQIPGFRTNRKIVVIESDDWGSIRSHKKAYDDLKKLGYNFDNDPYIRFDSLASEEDLTRLFDILSSVKDKHGNPAVLTANTIMANPDFEKIRQSDFKTYSFEHFTETLKKYPDHQNSFKLWQVGISKGVFHPQYHGREHVNTTFWLKRLQENDKNARISFDAQIYGFRILDNNPRNSFMRALDFFNEEESKVKEAIVLEGLEMFNKTFGYNSTSFIAPSYVWSSNIEKALSDRGVKYLQGIRYQYIPVIGDPKYHRKLHYFGQKNKYNQRYLVRNAFFEPSLTKKNKSIQETLKRINLAFRWKKPAIIGSHRLNFIGGIDRSNREENLIVFKELLDAIILRWPDVEFMSSDQLGLTLQKG